MRCPGQDPRYWTEDRVFEVPCPECGAAVEVFKDEPSGRCRKCGHRFRNPGVDFGCAEWCSLAEQCLGFVPETSLAPPSSQGALAGRLLREVKDALGGEPDRLARALRTYHHAKELVAKRGGDPRVVLAAALLLGLGPPEVKKALDQVGADEDTARRVAEVLDAFHAGKPLEAPELPILREADTLAARAEKR